MLNNLNIEVFIPDNLKLKNLDKSINVVSENKIIKMCDLIIAIEGDGTLIEQQGYTVTKDYLF